MSKIFKRKYERKIFDRAVSTGKNRRFLLDHFKKEWEEIEKTIEKDRKRRKLYETAKESGETLGFLILGMAAICGILVVGAVAPNIFSAFGRSHGPRRYFDKNNFRERINYYKKRGYIEVLRKKSNGTVEIKLTNLGEKKVAMRALENLHISVPEKWDDIWRIVIFDIPEKNKWGREGLRERLKRLGFYPLQKSTFVFPYPCREEIEFLGRIHGVGHHLRYIETSNISFDADLKEFFNL